MLDIGQGDRVEYEELPTGSGNWTTVKNARNITPPKGAFSRADFSHLETPVGSKSQKPGASGDWAAATFDVNYDPAEVSHGRILTDASGRVQRNWRVVLRSSIDGSTQQTMTWLGSIGDAGIGQLERDTAHQLAVSVNVDELPVYA